MTRAPESQKLYDSVFRALGISVRCGMCLTQFLLLAWNFRWHFRGCGSPPHPHLGLGSKLIQAEPQMLPDPKCAPSPPPAPSP